MLSKRHHKCYERLKKEESIFTADHENLLLDPGLGRKRRILTQKKKKKEDKISWCGSSYLLILAEQKEVQLERGGVEKQEGKLLVSCKGIE